MKNDSHPDTPDAVMLKYVEKMNDGDLRGSLDLTISSFHPLYEESLEEYPWTSPVQMSIYNLNVIYSGNMTALQTQSMNENITRLESVYGIEIQDYCILTYISTLSRPDGSVESKDIEFSASKIDSKWYINYEAYEWG